MALDVPLDYQMERYRAFDALPETVKLKIITDPFHMNPAWIVECGLQNCMLSLGQMALDMAVCQSPLEMFLYLAFERLRYKSEILDIEAQKEVTCNGRKYRADFLITFAESRFDQNTPVHSVVIECDGHDFHEKTKKQAARDKQRDRDMQISGYGVMRFTGSEIYKDADACVYDIFRYICNKLGQMGE